MKPLDESRCRRGLEQVCVSGSPRPERNYLIEDAIARLQSHPDTALVDQYLGIKSYAHFGDQREDHSYGMGPRHGSIVFRIERNGRTTQERKATAIDECGIYLLEATRDFGAIDHPCGDTWSGSRSVRQINLCDLLTEIARAEDRLIKLRSALVGARVESHVS